VTVAVKICGLTEPRGLKAAVDAGAAYVGFVFFRRSPRFIAADQAAALVDLVPRGVIAVGLFVDPTDAELDRVLARVPLGMIQLHGSETPARVAAVKARTGLKAMKVLGIAVPKDVIAAKAYEGAADRLLFDAKPPPGATRPGGNALAFDWALVRAYAGPLPWGLAGGLTKANVAAAIAASGATMLDVSSGVESRPGIKSPAKIRAFMAAVAAADLAKK
jgi:phosphoribosylanthranilate isomerase